MMMQEDRAAAVALFELQAFYMEGRSLRIADKVSYRDAPFFEADPGQIAAVHDAAAAQLRMLKQAA